MSKILKKKSANNKWIILGIVSVIIGAPNGTIIKSVFSEIDSTTFTFLKFAMMMVVFSPAVFMFLAKNKEIIRRNSLNLALSAVGTVVSIIASYKAIEYSTASYVSIISLLAPIMLVILSNKLIKEKIVPRAVAGITLAAVGGLLTILLPALLRGSVDSVFYPLATVLVLINCMFFPISTIYQRKSNEAGVPFSVYAGITAMATTLAVLVMSMFESGVNNIVTQAINMPTWGWVAIAYSAFVVTFVSRTLWIKAYERMGSAVSGGLSYSETLLSIALPMIILGEKLSIELIVGAVLIMLGVYLAESRPGSKTGRKKHFSTHLHYLHRHSQLR